jgi:hypothetical protein
MASSFYFGKKEFRQRESHKRRSVSILTLTIVLPYGICGEKKGGLRKARREYERNKKIASLRMISGWINTGKYLLLGKQKCQLTETVNIEFESADICMSDFSMFRSSRLKFCTFV